MNKTYRDLAEVLADMPKVSDTIADLKARNKPYTWVATAANTSESCACFLKGGKMHNGNRAYQSPCPNYDGYWLNGGASAVQCKSVDFALPGIIHHLYCGSHCAECPLYAKP